ncbi:MAG: IclR family transcriptional regulator [Burkholderiaceae bacterium]
MDKDRHRPDRQLPTRPDLVASGPPAAVTRDRHIVTPFARALSILSAFTPEDRWLCNGELAGRTGLPASTVTRMTRTLVTLGYLRCAADARRFYLGSSTLALGYRAAADSEIHRAAHPPMRQFAERHQVHVQLCARDRLDLVVIDSCRTPSLPAALQPGVGTRLGLTSTAPGWALLASLPDAERHYLLRSAEHPPACGWSEQSRQMHQAIERVREHGFCVAPGESGSPMTMVATPVQFPGEAPLAASCMGPSRLIGRARSVGELGPALARMAREIQRSSARP